MSHRLLDSTGTSSISPFSASDGHEEGVYHPIFGIDKSEVNAGDDDTPASTGLYIGRETIQRQVQNAQNMLYAVPVSSNTAAVNVSNLSELSQSGQLQLGSRLGSHASSVAITGALDFCSFLNGTYLRLKGISFSGKPVFRTKEVATSLTPSFCNGNHLFLFYHQRNAAWVIGMKVNAGSGACAYFVSDKPSPELTQPTEAICWNVSTESGGFSKCATMRCEIMRDADIDPPPDFHLPEDQPVGRHEAEAMLRQTVRRLRPQSATGSFVLRESTSVPNAHVISIVTAADNNLIEHIIVSMGADGRLYMGHQYLQSQNNAENAASFTTFAEVYHFGAHTGFWIQESLVKLTQCIHGSNLLG